MVWNKVLGGLTFVLGLLIVIGFPFFGVGKAAFQPESRGKAGVIFGLMVMAIGLYFILA